MPPSPLNLPQPKPSWLRAILELLSPSECLVCRRASHLKLLCTRCQPDLPNLRSLANQRCPACFSCTPQSSTTPLTNQLQLCQACRSFPLTTDSIRFIWEYNGLVRDLIRSMKYRPSIALTHLCADILSNALTDLYPNKNWDLVVPIPASRQLFKRRLFYPCNEIAQRIAKNHRILLTNPLRQNTKRAPQSTLNHDQRLKRLHSSFGVSKPSIITGKRVLLIEDVITTGATIAAVSYTLKRYGALEVDVLALARTAVWERFRRAIHELLPL
jgi:ComF family protein